jgi:hypothetical protein
MKKQKMKATQMVGAYMTGLVGGLIAILCLLNLTDMAVSSFEHMQNSIRKHKTYPITAHDSAYAWVEDRIIINL